MAIDKAISYDKLSTMDLALPPDRGGSPEVDRGKTVTQKVGGSQGVSDRVSEQTKSSWASIVADKKVLKKYDVEVSTKEGVHTVEIPDEVLENSTPLWEDFIVGKFLDQAPHVAKVHMVLNKIWRYGDPSVKIEVYEVNNSMMRFKVSSSKAREKILKRCMWNIVGVPMVVSKWTPTIEEEKQEEDAIPMWVHLEKVPLHMFSWEGLSFITSPVGCPVKLHAETIACTNLDEAKVLVKVDVTKSLPREITFTKDGKTFTVKYYYPWLSAKCSYCGKWGHGESVCAKKSKDSKKKEAPKSPNRDNGVSVGIKMCLDGTDKSQSEMSGVEEKDSEKKAVEVQEISVQASDVLEANVNAWALVSPAKSGRGQNNRKVDDQSSEVYISASKYSVLETSEMEEGEIPDVEEDLEMDVSESDLLEDDILDHHENEKVKSGVKKGRGRGKGLKAKTQAANPVKSTRSSRRQH